MHLGLRLPSISAVVANTLLIVTLKVTEPVPTLTTTVKEVTGTGKNITNGQIFYFRCTLNLASYCITIGVLSNIEVTGFIVKTLFTVYVQAYLVKNFALSIHLKSNLWTLNIGI